MTEPATYPKPRKSRTRLIVALIAFAVVAVGVIWFVAVPKVADRIDSGVQACKFISEGLDANGQPTGAPSTASPEPEGTEAEQYKDLRDVFAGSRHDDIEQAGTKFVDDAYSGDIFGALGSYSDLAGACANHGYPLPPLDLLGGN